MWHFKDDNYTYALPAICRISAQNYRCHLLNYRIGIGSFIICQRHAAFKDLHTPLWPNPLASKGSFRNNTTLGPVPRLNSPRLPGHYILQWTRIDWWNEDLSLIPVSILPLTLTCGLSYFDVCFFFPPLASSWTCSARIWRAIIEGILVKDCSTPYSLLCYK